MITSVQVAIEAVFASLRKPQTWLLAFPGGIVFMEAVWAMKLSVPLAADRLGGKLGVALTVFLGMALLAAAWTALSWVWLSFDRYFFSNPGWISNPGRGLSVMTMAALYLFGWGFLTWIVLLAVAPRIGGPDAFDAGLLLPLTDMPKAYALIIAAMALLFLPLALRVGLACVLGACEPGEPPTAQLKRLMKTTRRKGAALLLPLVIFLPLIAVLIWSSKEALSADSPVTALPLVLVFAAALLPVAAAQVSLSRHFFGVSKFGEEFQTHDIIAPGAAYSDAPDQSPLKEVKAAGLKGDEATLSEETISIAKYDEGAPPDQAESAPAAETPPPPPPPAAGVVRDGEIPPPAGESSQPPPPPPAAGVIREGEIPPPVDESSRERSGEQAAPPPANSPLANAPLANSPLPPPPPSFDNGLGGAPSSAAPPSPADPAAPPPAPATAPPPAPTAPSSAPAAPTAPQPSISQRSAPEPAEGDIEGSEKDEKEPDWAAGLWDE